MYFCKFGVLVQVRKIENSCHRPNTEFTNGHKNKMFFLAALYECMQVCIMPVCDGDESSFFFPPNTELSIQISV